MSSTTQVTNFQDIYSDVLNRARVDTALAASVVQAKRYVNIALQDMHLGFEYRLPWTIRRAELRTHAPYTTGTCSLSIGGTALTGASTLWNTANSYSQNNARTTGKILVAGGSDIYRISAVGSDTAITLRGSYVASEAASADTYIYYEDEYALAADFLRPVDFKMFSTVAEVPLINRTEFNRRFPRPTTSGRPTVATLLDDGVSGSATALKYVQFYPYPAATYIIPYEYITSYVATSSAGVEATALSADTDEPLMPLRYRHAIVFGAMYHWYRDKKNDARAQAMKSEYVDIMLRIASDFDIGTAPRAKFMPQVGLYSGRAHHPYRRGAIHGSRFDTGERFDRME